MTAKKRAPYAPRRHTIAASWAWHDRAACKGEDTVLFFGPDGERQPERDVRERKAKAICARCPVRAECLNYALSRPEKYGTWGGLTEEERTGEKRRAQRRASESRRRAREAAEVAS